MDKEFKEEDLRDAFNWGINFSQNRYRRRIESLFLNDIDTNTDRRLEESAYENLLKDKRGEPRI